MEAVARIIVCIVFFYFAVFIHELGHLCVAWLVGWKPLSLTIGSDQSRTIFRIGDLRFNLGTFTLGGRARAVPLTSSLFRLKRLLFVAGGPAASIALAVVLWKLMNSESWLSLSAWWAETTVYFTFIAMWLCFCSLIPMTIRRGGRYIPNDMRSFFRVLTARQSDLNTEFASYRYYHVNLLVADGRMGEAEALLMQGFKSVKDILFARTYWINHLLQAGRTADAKAAISALLEKGIPSATRADVLDSLACIPIYYDHPELLEDAMRYIDEAIDEAPGAITLKGTKGSLLIEKGCLDEGMRMLEEVKSSSESILDKSISGYFIALGFHKKGEMERARNQLRSAIAMAPDCVVRTRVEKLMMGGGKREEKVATG